MALLLNANNSVNRSYAITKPSPNHPLDVNGVGVRTENLVPPDLTRNYMALQGVIDGITRCAASTGGALYVIPASNSETYTIKVYTGDETLTILRCGFIDIATPTAGRLVTQAKEITNAKNPSLTTTNSANKPYFIFQVTGLYANEHGLADVMINTGSTAKPYEPYGYKIPISNGGVTTNIYLGSMQTVRQIKKLVLTGNESGWVMSGTGRFYNLTLPDNPKEMFTVVSTHFTATTNPSSVEIGCIRFAGTVQSPTQPLIFNYDNGAIGLTAFKQWVADQYAAGIPVTIWYVLATPETDAVNEPLMKIGDYADTISNATAIPTTEGANTITVDTTVQPSEFTATWAGWHNTEVKEKSENLFDGSYTDGYIGGDTGRRYSTSSAAKTAIAKCEPNTTYTIKKITSSNRFTIATSASYPQDSEIVNVLFNSPTETTATITTPADASYLLIYVSTSSEQATPDMMLNTGSTALPYEPYWK